MKADKMYDDDDDARIDLIDSVRASVTPSSSPPTISQATRYTTVQLLLCSPLPELEFNILGDTLQFHWLIPLYGWEIVVSWK